MELNYKMIIGVFLISVLSYAQKTGIGTENPLSDLHVNGDISIASSIHVGATATAKGSAGNTGEVLVSKGAGNSPQWTNLDNILSPSVYQVTRDLFIGYAYDFETTQLRHYNSGSHEVFLRFELFKRGSRINAPRFF